MKKSARVLFALVMAAATAAPAVVQAHLQAAGTRDVDCRERTRRSAEGGAVRRGRRRSARCSACCCAGRTPPHPT